MAKVIEEVESTGLAISEVVISKEETVKDKCPNLWFEKHLLQ